MSLDLHQLSNEVRKSDCVEKRVKIELLVQPLISLLEEQLALDTLFEASSVLHTAAKLGQDGGPESLEVPKTEFGLGGQRAPK